MSQVHGSRCAWQPDPSARQLPAFAEKYRQPLLGDNVFIFSPGMDMQEVQTLIDTISGWQTGNESEFSRNRFALLFTPGTYHLDIQVGYYMQIM